MMQLIWANFLHLYQPPTQSKNLLHKIAKECYVPLAEGFEKYRNVVLTVNINGALTELLAENGYKWLLRKIGRLLKNGKIELVESAKYHPILPLLPEDEVVRQIESSN